MDKKVILLKLTGELLLNRDSKQLDSSQLITIVQQIKQLNGSHYIGIVIGGGNFFRGSRQGVELGISASNADQVGMLATIMNGIILKDVFEQHQLPCSLFCAVPSPEVGAPVSQQGISAALNKGHCLIFSGGTGNPFFSTDTTAVLRALQIEAHEVWKGTHVDGIYTADPKKYPDAQLIETITYQEALLQRLKIMDATAIALAQQHHLPLRVFNIFDNNVLIKVANSKQYGSIITD